MDDELSVNVLVGDVEATSPTATAFWATGSDGDDDLLGLRGQVRVLAAEDVNALCAVPGVGKKTATRLLVELKSKLDLPDVDLSSIERPAPTIEAPAHMEVRQALESLGYSGDEVRHVLAQLPTEGDPALLTRDALRLIAEGV